MACKPGQTPAFLLALISCVTAQGKPRIVTLLSDDLGIRDTTVYGSQDVRTPNFKRLAAKGMTSDNAFVASPLCAPSRAAPLTSLMPARNGAEASHTNPRDGTFCLTASLRSLGNEVAAFGKVALRNYKPQYGFDFFSGPRVGFEANMERYFQQRTPERPVCLMVGNRRPHDLWTKDSLYDPSEIGLPPPVH